MPSLCTLFPWLRHLYTHQLRPGADAFPMPPLSSALPIQAATLLGMHTVPIETWAVPCVWMDTTDRPDLADLGRVHQQEGDGDVLLTWIGLDMDTPQRALLLHVAWQRPVTTSLLLLFPLPMRHTLLSAIATQHCLLLRSDAAPAYTPTLTLCSLPELLTLEQDSAHLLLTLDATTTQGLCWLLEQVPP